MNISNKTVDFEKILKSLEKDECDYKVKINCYKEIYPKNS